MDANLLTIFGYLQRIRSETLRSRSLELTNKSNFIKSSTSGGRCRRNTFGDNTNTEFDKDGEGVDSTDPPFCHGSN